MAPVSRGGTAIAEAGEGRIAGIGCLRPRRRDRPQALVERVDERGVGVRRGPGSGFVEEASRVVAHCRSSSRIRRSARVARWTTTAMVGFETPIAAAASSGVRPER